MKRSTARNAGFTLLEIMIVVSIIVMLLGAAIFQMRGQLGAAKVVTASGDIETYGTALMTYESMNGSLPSTGQGLKALVERPTGDPKPRRWVQGMTDLVMDPWGQPYHYEQPGKHNPSGYDLYSSGPDKQAGTQDDIGNWK
jgi:general secretion pathway protein G